MENKELEDNVRLSVGKDRAGDFVLSGEEVKEIIAMVTDEMVKRVEEKLSVEMDTDSIHVTFAKEYAKEHLINAIKGDE